MKNLQLKFKRFIWKIRIDNLEGNTIFKYAFRPDKYKPIMSRIKFCKRIAFQYPLNKFSEQLEIMQKVYNSTLKIYEKSN